MSKSAFFRAVLLVALLAGLSIGCGDDDKTAAGPGNGGSGGVDAQFISELNGLQQDYFDANAVAFVSLEYLGPFIASAFNKVGSEKSEPAACFGTLVPGTTYIFNGSAYESSVIPGAPVDGVRFLMYQIVNGSPDLNNDIGYLELRCTESPSFSVIATLSVNGSNVFQFTVTGDVSSFTMSGYVFSPVVSSPFLSVLYVYYDYGYEDGNNLEFTFPGFYAGYGVINYKTEGVVDSIYTGAAVISSDVSNEFLTLWETILGIRTDPVGTISVGNGLFTDEWGVSRLVACFSGNIANPTITSAAATQCEDIMGEYEVGGLTDAQINNLKAGFLLLRTLHLTFSEIFQAALGIGGF